MYLDINFPKPRYSYTPSTLTHYILINIQFKFYTLWFLLPVGYLNLISNARGQTKTSTQTTKHFTTKSYFLFHNLFLLDSVAMLQGVLYKSYRSCRNHPQLEDISHFQYTHHFTHVSNHLILTNKKDTYSRSFSVSLSLILSLIVDLDPL